MILLGGDSFINGAELRDNINGRQSLLTFPAILAKEFTSVARGGYSNSSIARTVIERCEQGGITSVFVCWTFTGRYEFKFISSTHNFSGPWCNINHWTIQDDMSVIEKFFKKRDETILQQQIKLNKDGERNGIKEFAKSFFKNVGSSEYWETFNTLKEIIYLQNYLKVKNIPYLFTSADSGMLDNHTCSNPDMSIKSLLTQFDHSKWYWFPGNLGFYQWSIDQGFPIGATHPLEEAHAAAAELIRPKFEELLGRK